MDCGFGYHATDQEASYHRIVKEGADTRDFHCLVIVVANLVLLPFAVALLLRRELTNHNTKDVEQIRRAP